jgi:O-antigen/teichoic acid export membrane protein
MTSSGASPAPGGLAALYRRQASRLSALGASDTGKAAGLAGAMIVNNVIALGSTFLFARLINDYGALAALVSYLLILTVAGQAMQVATAREGVLGHLGLGEDLIATVKRWSRTMLGVTLVLTVVSILLRHSIASLVGGHTIPVWGAAAGLPAGCLYLQLSLLRGALQGIGDYRTVGLSLIAEQGSRLIIGALLAVAGLSVTGAFLGSLASYIAMSIYCAWELRRRIPAPSAPSGAAGLPATAARAALGLWTHVRRAWAPIAGLIVIAVLQNIDVIAAKHRFEHDNVASSYAASAVAAKVLIWVAMGAGFYLVPEVSRRRAEGQDTRVILLRALSIVGICAVPVLAIFALAAHPLIQIAFGSKRTLAAGSLLPLGAAFTVLACTYLAVQYMLALKRTLFLVVIGVVAAAEPMLLLQASRQPAGFAAVVLAVQAVGALLAFAMALRRGNMPPTTDAAPTRDRPLGRTWPKRAPAEVLAPADRR